MAGIIEQENVSKMVKLLEEDYLGIIRDEEGNFVGVKEHSPLKREGAAHFIAQLRIYTSEIVRLTKISKSQAQSLLANIWTELWIYSFSNRDKLFKNPDPNSFIPIISSIMDIIELSLNHAVDGWELKQLVRVLNIQYSQTGEEKTKDTLSTLLNHLKR